MDKEWFVNVVPWLRIVIKIAAAVDRTKAALAVISEFPFRKHTKEMKDLIDALGVKENQGKGIP